MKESIPIGKMAILADGCFNPDDGKTATGTIRYRSRDVVAVIDSQNVGRSPVDICGAGEGIPIVADLRAALEFGPEALLIGSAPMGGRLPEEWRRIIEEAIDGGLDIINGLHHFLADDEGFREKAGRSGSRLVDLRRPPDNLTVAQARCQEITDKIILTVGTDCVVGKMASALELERGLIDRGYRTTFIPTGQTGMVIKGYGVAIDAVVSDFAAGAIEQLIVESAPDNDYLIIEGQGSLYHPGYSGVTLSLIHGSLPDYIVICHRAGLDRIDGYTVKIPDLSEVAELHLKITEAIKPCRVLGVALNTFGLPDDEALGLCTAIMEESRLPTIDPVRFGPDLILNELETSP
ncbi:DUF1611 domain-containing protein [candidate division KSB1 bacterium]